MGTPETRRRGRKAAPSIGFVLGILVLAAVIGGIIVLVWALTGFGEGSEGALAAFAAAR
jgi:hypothetical protein